MKESERKTYTRASARVLTGTLALGFAGAIGSLAVVSPPEGAPPTWLRMLFAACGIFLGIVALRSFSMRVVVTSDEVTIHGPLRRRRIPVAEIQAIGMPDDSAPGGIPYLKTRTAERVRLLPLTRTKNRAWGDDRTARELVHMLANSCGVSVIENPERASRHKFG